MYVLSKEDKVNAQESKQEQTKLFEEGVSQSIY